MALAQPSLPVALLAKLPNNDRLARGNIMGMGGGVLRIEVTEQETPVFGGTAFGAVGTYERLHGRVLGELDPTHRLNAGVVNLDKAARNARGRVEYQSDFRILKPLDLDRGNGCLVYDVPNRQPIMPRLNGAPHGGHPQHASNGFPMRRGFTVRGPAHRVAGKPDGSRRRPWCAGPSGHAPGRFGSPLLAGAEHAGDGMAHPVMGIRDHQLDALEAARDQPFEKSRPERFGLRRPVAETDDLAAAFGRNGDSDYCGDRDDAPAVANLQVRRRLTTS